MSRATSSSAWRTDRNGLGVRRRSNAERRRDAEAVAVSAEASGGYPPAAAVGGGGEARASEAGNDGADVSVSPVEERAKAGAAPKFCDVPVALGQVYWTDIGALLDPGKGNEGASMTLKLTAAPVVAR